MSSSSSSSFSSNSSSSVSSSSSTQLDCIQARITANIKAALKTLTKANGYRYDIGGVEEARKQFEINNRWEFILILENEPLKDEADNLIIRKLQYVIWFFSRHNDELIRNPSNPSSDLDTEIAYYNRNIIADITRCLTASDTDIYRGGLAELTEVFPGTHDLYEGPNMLLFGTWCVVEVTTNIDARNPYTIIQLR